MAEKSILEQALLQVQTLEEAVKQNAKGILASTMKQELNDLLKEAEEEEETPSGLNPEEEEDDMSDDAEGSDEDSEVAGDDELDADAENDTDLDNEPKGIDSMDSDDEMSSDDDMSDEGMDSDDVMDMTGASDDEVLKVFKSMKPEDGIVVKKDGNNIEFGDGEDDYIIKLDDEETEEPEMADENWTNEEEEGQFAEGENEPFEKEVHEEEDMEEEVVYEIEVDEEEESEPKEVEATEAARTIANGVRPPAQKKKFKAGRHEMNEGTKALTETVEKLKKQNGEYKKALVLFKEKLNEVAVFNANLAYATRLFTEHSTTKQEKLEILKRFDTVSTMNESKGLFNTIKTELGSKKTVTESVVDKITTAPTSSSTEVLSEAKAYENPQFKRMKDLMSKIK